MSGDLFHHVHQLIDGDQFTAAQIDGFVDVAFEDCFHTLDAVVDVHEAAGLMAVTPNLDLVIARHFGFEHFAADGRGGLLPAAVPCAMRAVDVVKPRHPALQAEVFLEVAAHAFAEKFLPSVAVFRQGRIGIFFFQRDYIGTVLLVPVVDAGGRGVEEPLGRHCLWQRPACEC